MKHIKIEWFKLCPSTITLILNNIALKQFALLDSQYVSAAKLLDHDQVHTIDSVFVMCSHRIAIQFEYMELIEYA